jgi:hypothetical protein
MPWVKNLEVRAGIEPAYADLQSATSPLCHRTKGGTALYILGQAASVKFHLFFPLSKGGLPQLSYPPRARYKGE